MALGQGAALLLILGLAGCDVSFPNGALDLYHGLEGGPIADQRPPPPGVDSPYPKIGTTPARPPAADVAAQQRIGDTLAAQRDDAAAAAAKDPVNVTLPAAPPPPAPPRPATPDPNANRVVVDAAPAPPVSPVTRPLPGVDSVPAVPAMLAAGPMPDLASAPPPPPAGLELAEPLPPPSPPIVASLPPPLPNGVAIVFTPGSATLPPSANLTLRRFAMAHRGAQLAVTGRGDGVLTDADAQSRALALALKRAAAIAASLGADGVAPGKLSLRAEALGAGGTATLN